MAIRTAIPTTRQTYQTLNASALRRGDTGDCPEVTKQKALNLVASKIARGGILTAGYAVCTKTGNLIATLAVIGANGQIIHSPTLDAIAIGMGVLTAARWLIEMSREADKWRKQPKGGIAEDVLAIRQFENDPNATYGTWADEQ